MSGIIDPEPNTTFLDGLVFTGVLILMLQFYLGRPFDTIDKIVGYIIILYLAIRGIAYIYFTYFWEPKIDPKYKGLWKDGWEEGVKKLKKLMEEEEAPA